jgi:hypothetical protein
MRLLELARRTLVISALGLWLGGFTVYTAFVIPIGHRHFPGRQFGFVTAKVTTVLAILSAAAVLLAAVDLATTWRRLPRAMRWAGLATGAAILGALAGSVVVHAKLDALLNVKDRLITDPGAFEPLHERYELLATTQWALGLLYLGGLLSAWRKLDRSASADGPLPVIRDS